MSTVLINEYDWLDCMHDHQLYFAVCAHELWSDQKQHRSECSDNNYNTNNNDADGGDNVIMLYDRETKPCRSDTTH